jgi:hypothetical protein
MFDWGPDSSSRNLNTSPTTTTTTLTMSSSPMTFSSDFDSGSVLGHTQLGPLCSVIPDTSHSRIRTYPFCVTKMTSVDVLSLQMMGFSLGIGILQQFFQPLLWYVLWGPKAILDIVKSVSAPEFYWNFFCSSVWPWSRKPTQLSTRRKHEITPGTSAYTNRCVRLEVSSICTQYMRIYVHDTHSMLLLHRVQCA